MSLDLFPILPTMNLGCVEAELSCVKSWFTGWTPHQRGSESAFAYACVRACLCVRVLLLVCYLAFAFARAVCVVVCDRLCVPKNRRLG